MITWIHNWWFREKIICSDIGFYSLEKFFLG